MLVTMPVGVASVIVFDSWLIVSIEADLNTYPCPYTYLPN